MNAQSIIDKLGLTPLSIEGGYFYETYRSEEIIPQDALDSRYGGGRATSTAIYYLLTPDTISRLHRLKSDEIFHFYAGDSVEMLQLEPDGSHRLIIIGNDLDADQQPQVIAPRGVWQGCRLVKGGSWALMGTTVAPAFDYADYETPDIEALAAQYPECAEMIRALG